MDAGENGPHAFSRVSRPGDPLSFPTMNTPKDILLSSNILCLAVAGIACLWASPVFGESYTWTGASGDAWSDSANWNPSGVPNSKDTGALFNNSGNGNTTINLASSPEVKTLVFDSPSAASYVLGLSGQQLTIANTGSVTLNAGVTANQAIVASIKLGTPDFIGFDTYWTNNSTANLTVSGATMTAGGNGQNGTLYLQGSGAGISTITSAINDNDAELAVWVQGTSTWQLLGANTFGGGVKVLEGTLVVNSIADAYQASSIGSSSTDAANFRVATNANATLRYIGPDTSTNKNWSIGSVSSITATFDIVANTLTMNGSCNTYDTASNLAKTGNGTLALNGSNIYSGATIISEGTLAISSIANGGQDSGIGKASADASNLVFDGGTLQLISNGELQYTDRAFTITDGKIAAFDLLNNAGLAFNGGAIPFTTGGISLSGNGSLLLVAQNAYTGPTTVNGGTLFAGSSSSAHGGPLGIHSDLDLTSAGTLQINLTYYPQGNPMQVTIGSLTGLAGSTVNLSSSVAQESGTLTIASSNNATFGGVIADGHGPGITNVGLIKTTPSPNGPGGMQTLTGNNTYGGATYIQSAAYAGSPVSQAGGITLAGNGSIASSSGIVISGGASLIVENSGTAVNTNRIGDTAGVTMYGGTLSFTSESSAVNISETLGALALGSGTNTVSNGQAAPGLTSTLTFASLARIGSATVNFAGAGLGVDDRNRIFFTTAPTLGDWAIYNGVGYATYDVGRGVVEALYQDVTRGSSGQKLITSAPEGNIRVIDGSGTPGAIGMGAAGITDIHRLVQSATSGPVTVNVLSGETFQAMSVLVGSNAGALTIGSAPNTGNFSSSDQALTPDLRRLSLINNSSNPLVVNSTITNAWIYGGPMAIAIEKLGAGTVFLAGNNTYNGVTTIGQGVLSISTIGNGGMPGNLGAATSDAANLVFAGGTLHYTGSATTTDRGFTVNGTGSRLNTDADLHFSGNAIQLSSGSLTIGGAGNTTLRSMIAGGGALDKDGASTLTLQGANSFTGGVTIRGGAVGVTTIGDGGQAGNLGAASNASANLVLDGGSLVYNASGITGSDRGLTVTANGGTFVNANAAADFFLANGSPVSIAKSGVFTVDGPGSAVIGNAIIGAGALRKTGDGQLFLDNPGNSFTGGVTISGGTLGVAAISNGGVAGYLGAATVAASNLVFDGGTLAFDPNTSATLTSNRSFSITAGKTATFDMWDNSSLRLTGSVPATTGGLTKTGNGTLALAGNMAFAGQATVSAGTLLIDGTLGAGTYPSDSVYAAAGATLGGSGTIGRDVYISGTQSPGSNGPGVQTIDGAVVYDNPGATVDWELVASTTAGRGTNYDGINGNGNVANFLKATTLDLIFNAPGSTVKWSDGLWGANQQWVVYSGFTVVGFENLSIASFNWADSTGALFNAALPGSTFSIAQSGQSIVLSYSGVPEPSITALLAMGTLALLFFVGRKKLRVKFPFPQNGEASKADACDLRLD